MKRFRMILLSMGVAALVGATVPGQVLASCASNPECNPTDICCNPANCSWRASGYACNPAGCATGQCKNDGMGGKICTDLVPEVAPAPDACKDNNDCTQNICTVATGTCSFPNTAAGAAQVCNVYGDANYCTIDLCTGIGIDGTRFCEEGTDPENCSGSADACNDADCIPETGCYSVPKLNSTVCTPTPDRCTEHHCNNGVCGVIMPVGTQCEGDNANDSDGMVCTKGFANGNNNSGCCDSETQGKASGYPCEDNNGCTTTSVCNGSGTCTGTVCASGTATCSAAGCGTTPVTCTNVTPLCGCGG